MNTLVIERKCIDNVDYIRTDVISFFSMSITKDPLLSDFIKIEAYSNDVGDSGFVKVFRKEDLVNCKVFSDHGIFLYSFCWNGEKIISN